LSSPGNTSPIRVAIQPKNRVLKPKR
jgi:hypothetical protein